MSAAEGRQLQIRVEADAAQLRGVRRKLSRYLAGNAVEREAAGQIVLCVSEAVSNAIQHSGTTAPIVLEAGLCDGRVTVRISDEGSGLGDVCIDPSRAADPAQPSGRGFFLIWSLMDELEVSQNCGTIVRMSKQVHPEATAARIAACSEGQSVPQRESQDLPESSSRQTPPAPARKPRRRRPAA
jgi:anti-sigma regulatory factor (Ser/Thr protein kinase)